MKFENSFSYKVETIEDRNLNVCGYILTTTINNQNSSNRSSYYKIDELDHMLEDLKTINDSIYEIYKTSLEECVKLEKRNKNVI